MSPPPLPRSSQRRAGRAAAAAALVAAVVAGCSSGGDDAGPATTTTRAATTTTTAPPAVTVLDAGDEPHRVVEITLTEGDQVTSELTVDQRIDQLSEGRRQRLDPPPIRQAITYDVRSVDATGADLAITMGEPTVLARGSGLSAQDVAQLEADLSVLAGVEGTARMAPTGEVSDVAFEPVDAAGDQGDDATDLAADVDDLLTDLEDQVSSLGLVLPTEPVGVGAVWERVATATIGGVTSSTTTRYEITALDDEEVTVELTTTATAEPQDLGDADGATTRLRSSELTGRGRATRSLTSMREEGESTASGTQELEITTAGATTGLTQELEVKTALRPSAG